MNTDGFAAKKRKEHKTFLVVSKRVQAERVANARDSESEWVHLTGGDFFLLDVPALRSLRSLRFAKRSFRMNSEGGKTHGGTARPTLNPTSNRVTALPAPSRRYADQ
jgi:hypothetical protein